MQMNGTNKSCTVWTTPWLNLLFALLLVGGVAQTAIAFQDPPDAEKQNEEEQQQPPEEEEESPEEEEEIPPPPENTDEERPEDPNTAEKDDQEKAAEEAKVRREEQKRKMREAAARRRNAREKLDPTGGAEPASTGRPTQIPLGVDPQNPERPLKMPTTTQASTEIHMPEDIQLDLPPEERMYSFSIDGEYSDLIEAFSRMSGLGVMGNVPAGHVSFKSTQEMDYKTAFNRIRTLLFKHPDNLWLQRTENVLEIIPVNEMSRPLPLEYYFPSVEAFNAAELDENELVILIYSPEKGSVDDLIQIRDYLPDYVLAAPMQNPDQNAMTIFALVKDVRKFLDLVGLFDQAGKDPRKFKKIPVEHLLPSEALTKLGQLMDLSGSGAAPPTQTRSRDGKVTLQPARSSVGQPIKIFPDDEQGVLIVRALPTEFDQIEEVLSFIDLPLPEENGEYVIIDLEHVQAAEIMAGLQQLLAAGQAGAAPVAPVQQPRRGRRGQLPSGAATPAAPAPAMPVQSDEVTVYPDTRLNRLIVLGDEEQVQRVRDIVALLDVEKGESHRVVVLENSEPAEIAELLPPLVNSVYPPSPGATAFSATPDPTTHSLVLVGSDEEMDLAADWISKWDNALATPSVHSTKVKYIAPSELAGLLSQLEGGPAVPRATPAPPQPPARDPQGRPTRVRPQQPRQRNVSTEGKFIGDDKTKMIYVVCTDAQWEDDYLPRIQEFDQNAAPPTVERVTIAVTEGDPETIIATVTQILGGEEYAPRMVAVDEGVMVVDADPDQLAQIEQIVADLDKDPSELKSIERRTFKINHADTSQVADAIMSFIGQDSAGKVVQTPQQPGRPRTTRAPASSSDITIVDLGGSLMVSAPAAKMPDIEELIAQIDVPNGETEIRTYPVPAGVNVVEMADTLRQLHGGGGTGVPRPGRRGAPANPAGAVAADEVTIIARPAARKILISAPIDAFAEIEESIALLSDGGGPVEIVTGFIDCEEGNAATLAAQIEPILDAKYQEMVATGVLPAESAGPDGRGGGGRATWSLQPDPRGDRIIVAAPKPLVDEAKTLIKELDRPGNLGERVIRTVKLEKADPQEMAAAITNMIASGQGMMTPRGAGAVRRGGREGTVPVPEPTESETLNVNVSAAPGGNAVVLVGAASDVDEVEGWIHKLDETVTGTGKHIKVFDLGESDMETVADTLMAVVDTGLGKAGRPEAEGEEGDDLGFSLELDITRFGKDLYVKGDYFADTLLVAATPSKMREVEEVMLMLVGDPTDPKKKGILPDGEPPVPYRTYELQTVEAYDAVYSLEGILDALWVPADDKPSVDYIPFTNILVIKGKPDRFDEVEELIKKYVDKGEKATGDKQLVKSVMGAGTSVVSAAEKIRAGMAAKGVEIEIISTTTEKPKLERIHPCLLPPHVFELAAVGAAVNAALAPAFSGEQEPQAAPKAGDETLSRNLQSLVESTSPTTQTGEAGDQGEAPAKKPVLQIIIDEQSGNLMFVGSGDLVEEAGEMFDELIDGLKDATQMPDIRIYRFKYIDPREAVDILDTVLNDRASRQAAQAAAAAAARQAQRAAQQAARQRQQQGGQEEEDKGGGRREGAPDQGQVPEVQQAQKPQFNVIMYPNSREKTLIVRAETELFPTIEAFLATIDRERTRAMDYKIFTLKNVVASVAKAHLEEMLGMDKPRAGASRGAARQAGRQGQPGQQFQQEGEMAIALPEGAAGSFNPAEDISMTAIDESNSLIVMAPEEPMKLVEGFINDLENMQRVEWVTVDYEVANADATQVAETLSKIYGEATGRGGGRAPAGGEAGTVPEKKVTIIGDSNAGLVFVTAASDMQEEIAGRIREIEEKATVKLMPKTIKVQMGRPTLIAEKIKEVLGGGGGGSRGGRNSQLQITGDDTTMQILVTAPEGMMQQIESIVATLDTAPPGVELKVYSLEYAKASEVVRAMDTLVSRVGPQLKDAGIKLDVYSASADDRSNSLVVVGGPFTFGFVDKALETLDAPPRDPTQIITAIYQLVRARATDVARNINQIYGGRQEAGVDPPKAEANEASNTLIVRGTKKQVEEIDAQIIKPLEEVPAVEKLTEVYFLKYADPGAVANAINNMSRSPSGQVAESERVDAVVDGAAQSVVVIATAEKQELVRGLVAEMDVDSEKAVNVRKTYKVKQARATDMATIITQTLDSGQRNTRSGKRAVNVVANDALNMLVITGSQEDYDALVPLIEELDRKPEEMLGLTPKVYPLEWADPGSTVTTITSVFPKLPGQGPEDTVRAAASWGSTALVVTASPENHERIAALLAEIDTQGTAQRDVHVVNIKHADAAGVAQSLRDSFGRTQGGARGGQEAVSISSPAGSSTLLIRANEKEFADIQAVIAQMDTADSELAGQVATIPLQYTDAQEMLTILQEYLRKPGAGGRGGGELSGDVRLSAVVATNSLVVSGDPEEIEQVKATVAKIDVEVENAAGTPQIVKLEHALPSDVEPALTALFAEQQGGRTPRGGSTTMKPVIVANDGSQSIIVRASAPDLKMIENLVAQMDTEDSEGGVSMKIITLPPGMRADEVADNLDDLLDDIEDNRRDSARGGRGGAASQSQRVLVTADNFSNSLILAGPKAKFAEVEELVATLQKAGPVGGRVTKMVKIKNRDPEEIKSLIEQMVNETQGGSGGSRSGNRGGGGGGGNRGNRGGGRR